MLARSHASTVGSASVFWNEGITSGDPPVNMLLLISTCISIIVTLYFLSVEILHPTHELCADETFVMSWCPS